MCLCGLSLQKNECLTIVCIDRLKNLCVYVVLTFPNCHLTSFSSNSLMAVSLVMVYLS